jgi:hypothetical protein
MQMSHRYGFLFISVAMFLFGLYGVINPKGVKRENADVPGFADTGFAWMPVWGWRLTGIALVALSGFFLYLFLTR